MENENTNNEAQAINELAELFTEQGEQPQEAQETQEQEAPKQEQEPQETPKQEPQNADMARVIELLTKLNERQEAQMQAPQEQAQDAALDELRNLGLDNVAAKLERLQELAQKQEQDFAARSEQIRRDTIFAENLTKLKADYPSINPDELGKWATQNGFNVGESYDGWRLLAMAYSASTAKINKPDTLTATSGGGEHISAFERAKKGESVSDIEFGAELLKDL